MNLIERYQDELYSLAFSLNNDEKKSKILAFKTFDDTLFKVYGSYNKIKLKLFKSLLSKMDSISVKRSKDKNFLYLFKKRLGVFDRKVFVLKFEFGLTSTEIAIVLEGKKDRVKKSLITTMEKLSKKMESKKIDSAKIDSKKMEDKNEM